MSQHAGPFWTRFKVKRLERELLDLDIARRRKLQELRDAYDEASIASGFLCVVPNSMSFVHDTEQDPDNVVRLPMPHERGVR